MNAPDFTAALGWTSLAASLLILLVLALQRLLRRYLSPQGSCALWLLVMIRLAPLSVASGWSLFNLLPQWRVEASPAPGTVVPPLAAPAASAVNTSSTAPRTVAVTIDPRSPMADEHEVVPSAPTWRPTGAQIIFGCWLAGAVALGIYVVVATVRLSRQLRSARPIVDAAAQRILRSCCDRMRVRTAPALFECDALATPALQGVLMPRLLLPPGFVATYDEQELGFVFLHELAHLKRGDLVLNWCAAVLQVLHWFNPLVWFGLARWRNDREIACDAMAVAAAGPERHQAYGRTILKLLEACAGLAPRPGMVGILEHQRDLARRLRTIAQPPPERRPGLGIALLTALAIVGLTDAQVDSPAVSITAPASKLALPVGRISVPLEGSRVVFLVQASQSMGDVPAASPASSGVSNWQRAVRATEVMLGVLPAGVSYQVVLFNDAAIHALAERGDAWFNSDDHATRDLIIARMRAVVPQGGANLERAVTSLRLLRQLDRIVFVVDGLPGRSESLPSDLDDENTRVRNFAIARKQLPPRVPVSTVLLPSTRDERSAAGALWELANATRGALSTFPEAWLQTPAAILTHVAFVIDASGSMRDPNTNGLWPIAIRQIDELLDIHAGLTGVQFVDASGRSILGAPFNSGKWLPNDPATREAIRTALLRYDEDTQSNLVPGIFQVFRRFDEPSDPDAKLAIYVLGDEFNTGDSIEQLVRRLDALNPADAAGNRRVAISAIGFPTTIRYQFAMYNTGVRFAHLMRLVTYEHGGTFVALPDL